MVPARNITAAITADENNIILALVYFDIFNYPLTEAEILSFSPQVMEYELQYSLVRLVDKEIIFLIDGYYCLQNEPLLIERRKKGNQLAEKKIKIARRL